MRSPTRAVGCVVHGGRPDARAAARAVAEALHARGVAVVGVKGDSWAPELPEPEPVVEPAEFRAPADFGADLDVVIALGGDGTFLRAAYLSRDCGVPVLGVNLGRVGFLSEVESAQLPEALGRLIDGDFSVEERMTLAVEVLDANGEVVGTSWAFNDASVERTVPQRLIVLEVRVDQTVLTHVGVDAVICATPTGSTAYAFSAGGPILSPLVDAILLTPVAPHSLFDRTIVVDPNETLSLRPVAGHTSCVVSCDGRESLAVPEGGSVRVSRGHAPVRLARLAPFDFYQRVRDKFGLA